MLCEQNIQMRAPTEVMVWTHFFILMLIITVILKMPKEMGFLLSKVC